jgi:hypothetical protein
MLGWTILVTRGAAATLEVGGAGPYPTIQDALAVAATGDVIEISPGTYYGPVRLGDVEVELVGMGAPEEVVILPAEGEPAAATVVSNAGAEITLRSLTISGGGQQYALFLRDADVFAEDLVLQGAAPDEAIELSIDNSDATFVNLSLVEPVDHLYQTGGHAEIFFSDVTFENSTFSGATTMDGIGGAIFTYDADLTFRGCTFTDNSAAEGGAVFFESVPSNLVTFEDTIFERNTATSGPGGALFQLDGQLQMTRTTVRDSSATDAGGGIAHLSARVFLFQDGLVEGNRGPLGGGLTLLDGLDASVLRSSFLDNESVGTPESDGGGILVLGLEGSLDIGGNLFCHNKAEAGGGIALTSAPELVASIHHNRFVTNQATIEGGAVSMLVTPVELVQNTIVDTLTLGARGAVFASGGAAVLSRNNAFAYNDGTAAFDEPPASVDGGYNLYFGNDVNLGSPEGQQSSGSWSDVLEDPEFQGYAPDDCASNLQPVPGSPMEDAGDPTVFDDNGTRSDIGAYGGAGAAEVIDLDGDGVIVGDCSPYDPEKTTGSEEVVADGVDQDCDGLDLCYVDGDGDGVGTEQVVTGPIGCADEGLALVTGDCDDANPELAADCNPVEIPDETEPPKNDDPTPDLRPAWFCSTTGAPGLPSLGLLLGLALLVRRRASR